MKAFFCGPLSSLAALVVYLAVNIGAAAVHHHHAPARACGELGVAKRAHPELHSASLADDDDSEDNCTLCSVLHQVRILAASPNVESLSSPSGETLPAIAHSLPLRIPVATQARAPPAA
jgi:hypothetical protein